MSHAHKSFLLLYQTTMALIFRCHFRVAISYKGRRLKLIWQGHSDLMPLWKHVTRKGYITQIIFFNILKASAISILKTKKWSAHLQAQCWIYNKTLFFPSFFCYQQFLNIFKFQILSLSIIQNGQPDLVKYTMWQMLHNDIQDPSKKHLLLIPNDQPLTGNH